jgi:hypothetical protein
MCVYMHAYRRQPFILELLGHACIGCQTTDKVCIIFHVVLMLNRSCVCSGMSKSCLFVGMCATRINREAIAPFKHGKFGMCFFTYRTVITRYLCALDIAQPQTLAARSSEKAVRSSLAISCHWLTQLAYFLAEIPWWFRA